ncbi:MAG: MoxR family ATPase [Lentisphaeraceae bacterium]|nr:MoxR family ATPase [Lentisphaeraceae bacterium]
MSEENTQDQMQQVQKLQEAYQKITEEVAKFIVGQEEVIEQVMIAVLAKGHCLLEGVPGLAKTALVNSLSQVMDLSFRRIQFTPDLMPSDITGTEIIQEDPTTGKRNLVFQHGPIFSQMVLADEINRTPPKTQASLLEAMQEHRVTVGSHTYHLEEPFFVLATQNPIEQEGTYPLPEAQRDRFMFHIKVAYPNREEEREIIARTTGDYKATLEAIVDGETIIACQNIVRSVPVPEHVVDFVLDIIRSCRPHEPEALPVTKELIDWGPGPRACQTMIIAGKVRALLNGRFHVTVEDIEALAHPILRHRLVPTFNAEAEGITVDAIIDQIIEATPRRQPNSIL